MGIGINLEDIMHKAAKPFVIAGASAYLMLNLIGCSGNAAPTPNPANNPSPKPSPTATYTPEHTSTAVATAAPTATATIAPKSTYELALERLNPQISQTARDFVKSLAEYNNSVGNKEELHKTYAGLERIVDVVERHPKIVNGLNQFGTDALSLLIADNLSVVDMDKYWFLTNATALQAQDFFYVANKIYSNGDYKEKMNGPLTNRKFDEKEREIANFRLRKQIEWQGPWSTPLGYEEVVREYGSEQRASNALRRRVLPSQIFVDDVVKGLKHSSFSTFDTNTWLVVASYNNEHSEQVKEILLARLNDPKRYAKDVDKIEGLYKGAATLRNVGNINQKASEYVDTIFLEGKPYEIAPILMYLFAREQMHHDNATDQSSLWASLIGSSGGIGAAQIIHPDGHVTWDTQFVVTLSKATEQKLNGVFVYGINDLARLLPLSADDMKNPIYLSLDGLFGIYSNIGALRQDGAKQLALHTPSFYGIFIPIQK